MASSDPLTTFELWTEDSLITDTNITNNTLNTETVDYKYIYVPTLLVIFCAISVVINIKILITAYWIKRPLTPTLHISLSLAGADAFASFHLGLGLLINSLLGKGLGIEGIPGCMTVVVEVFRLSGVIITVAHLLALAVNHYLGIIEPFRYPSIMTHRRRTMCIVFMWVIPIMFFLIYFSSIKDEGFQSVNCNDTDFLNKSKFRLTYSSLFFGPLILMSIIYTHIFIIVRRHQRGRDKWKQWSQWSQWSREHDDFPVRTKHDQRVITRSIKAIKTTLLILGSYIVGLMPAVLLFCVVCDDCLVTGQQFNDTVRGMDNAFVIYVFVNFLVIFKTMLNPIIYAARMHEIQKASSIMKARLCTICCNRLRQDSDLSRDGAFGMSTDFTSEGHHRLTQLSEMPGKPVRSNTIISRMRPHDPLGNGSSKTTSSLKRKSTRSHQRRRTELTIV